MEKIWGYVRENTAFWLGFASGGYPVARHMLHVPSLLGMVGDILKGSVVLIFSTASGLMLVVMTDLYKHYFKSRMIKFIDKGHEFIMSKLFKNDKSKKRSEKDKAA
jgi:hypothetical protein